MAFGKSVTASIGQIAISLVALLMNKIKIIAVCIPKSSHIGITINSSVKSTEIIILMHAPFALLVMLHANIQFLA